MRTWWTYSLNQVPWRNGNLYVWCRTASRRSSRISFKSLFSISKKRKIRFGSAIRIERHRKQSWTKLHHVPMRCFVSHWLPSMNSKKNRPWAISVRVSRSSVTSIVFLIFEQIFVIWRAMNLRRALESNWRRRATSTPRWWLSKIAFGCWMKIKRLSKEQGRSASKSTFALFSRKQMLLPYRNSVLTSIFRPFFIGRGRTIICCNINPCATFISQTNDLLKFSALAQKVSRRQSACSRLNTHS